MYDNLKTLSVTVVDGVAVATLSHGDLNFLDWDMLADLDQLGREIEADDRVKVLVFESANPDFFIAHADLNLVASLPPEPEPRLAGTLGALNEVLDRFRTMPKVTIAKIAGYCRGGGSELALACDMRFAAIGKTILGQPEVGAGIIPGAGGTVRLPRLIGQSRALEIILGCNDFTAELAERYGYINRALPADEIDDFVDELAMRIAGFPAESIAAGKASVRFSATLEEELNFEETAFFASVHTAPAQRRIETMLRNGVQSPSGARVSLPQLWDMLDGV